MVLLASVKQPQTLKMVHATAAWLSGRTFCNCVRINFGVWWRVQEGRKEAKAMHQVQSTSSRVWPQRRSPKLHLVAKVLISVGSSVAIGDSRFFPSSSEQKISLICAARFDRFPITWTDLKKNLLLRLTIKYVIKFINARTVLLLMYRITVKITKNAFAAGAEPQTPLAECLYPLYTIESWLRHWFEENYSIDGRVPIKKIMRLFHFRVEPTMHR